MESFFMSIGEERYRAKQVLDSIYQHPVSTFDEMTTLSKDLRKKLSEILTLSPLTLRTTVESPDGTIKHAYEIESLDGATGPKILLETVWMPAESTDIGPTRRTQGDREREKKDRPQRHTLCISSQLGCAAGCEFCATGKLGLHRQLMTGEIVYQVIHSKILYGKLPDTILFMGMGEPMHNFEAVTGAVEILTHPGALGMSPGRIVLSTAGELERLGAFRKRFPKIRLAISLNAATDRLRTSLMPINERFNLRAIRAFVSSVDLSSGELITLEYVVLGNINDTPKHAQALSGFLKPISGRIKVNLIPYNPVEGIDYKSPDRRRVLAIQDALKEIGIKTFIRRNRGRGVSAACGQLAGK